MRALLIIYFITTSSLIFSQNTKLVDSLIKSYEGLKEGIPKVKTLEELFYAEVYTNPKKGLEYAKKSLEQSINLNYWSGEGVALYHIGVYHKLIANLDSAMYYYNKSLKIWEKHSDKKREATALSSIAGLKFDEGKLDEAVKLTEKVIKINKEHGHWLNYGNDLSSLGNIHKSLGNLEIAYKMTLEALKTLDTIPREPWRKADAESQLGSIEYERGNYNSALIHFDNALKLYINTNDNIYQGHTYIDIGSTQHELKKYDLAIENFKKGLEIAKQINVKDMEANALSNIGMSLIKIGQYDKAIQFLGDAIKVNRINNSKSNLISSLGEMGNAQTHKNNLDVAIDYLNEAVKLSDSLGYLNQKRMALQYRANAFEKRKQYSLAMNDLRASYKINDSIFNKTKSKQIEELKTIYETEKKETEIALQQEEIETLNAKSKNDKLTKTLYGIGMFSFLTIAGLIYFSFKQRIKKNKIEREKQEAILKQEIEFKKKELASQTLHLVQKNTFIQELKDNLVKIKQSPELFKVEFRRLVMLLKKESAEDKDWEVFKSYFSEVHNNFDNKLKDIYSDISEKEIRLASFLRMNLSTKEIASMLNVLPESVLKSKYRLKKKLNLDKNTDLNDFLNGM